MFFLGNQPSWTGIFSSSGRSCVSPIFLASCIGRSAGRSCSGQVILCHSVREMKVSTHIYICWKIEQKREHNIHQMERDDNKWREIQSSKEPGFFCCQRHRFPEKGKNIKRNTFQYLKPQTNNFLSFAKHCRCLVGTESSRDSMSIISEPILLIVALDRQKTSHDTLIPGLQRC